MSDLQEILTQYKLSKTGDKDAIRCFLSNMGDGKFLKSDLPFELNSFLELAEQSEESAYKTLYTLKEVDPENEPLYFEPDYIKEEKKLAEEAQILAEAKAWKENLLAKKAAEEKARLKAEEEARQKAEEEARQKAEEEARQKAEEEAKKEKRRRIVEEIAKKAQLAKIEAEEKEREKEEQRRIEREKEHKFIEYLKEHEEETIADIICNMVYVESGDIIVGTPNDINNLPHSERVESFWILKNSLFNLGKHKWPTNFLSLDEQYFTCRSYPIREFIHIYEKAIKRLSVIAGCEFCWPSQNQFQMAKQKNAISWTKHEDAYSMKRLCCTSENFSAIYKKYRDKKLKRRKELWLSLIEKYLNATELFEYEEGILFMKKKMRVRYTKEPLTWRVWNAIMEKDFLDVWESKDQKAIKASQKEKNKNSQGIDQIMNRYHLDNFLKKINDYMAGKRIFEYVHDNKNLEGMLLKEGKIRYGVYLYTKED